PPARAQPACGEGPSPRGGNRSYGPHQILPAVTVTSCDNLLRQSQLHYLLASSLATGSVRQACLASTFGRLRLIRRDGRNDFRCPTLYEFSSSLIFIKCAELPEQASPLRRKRRQTGWRLERHPLSG